MTRLACVMQIVHRENHVSSGAGVRDSLRNGGVYRLPGGAGGKLPVVRDKIVRIIDKDQSFHLFFQSVTLSSSSFSSDL